MFSSRKGSKVGMTNNGGVKTSFRLGSKSKNTPRLKSLLHQRFAHTNSQSRSKARNPNRQSSSRLTAQDKYTQSYGNVRI